MDTITAITVARNADQHYRLAWDARFTQQPVSVYVASEPGAFDRSNAAAEGVLGQVEIELTDSAARSYFLLVPESDLSIIVAERNVPMAGGINFRDIGGYRTGSGRRLRWGRLFRSGHMSNLTADDKRYFDALAISTVCDFRLAEERENEKTELPGSPTLHTLGIPPGIGDKHFFHRLFAATGDPADVVDAMHQMLACLVRDAAPFYARLFDVLLSDPPGAVLLNCSAGKERTGVGTALLLSALGVPRDTIMYDFMLSGTYFPVESEVPRALEKYAVQTPGEAGRALIMPLLETRESYLEAAFAAIDEDFGSSEDFLRENYALDAKALARLRELYTN